MKAAKHTQALARIENLILVDEAVWADLKRDLAPISDSYLRTILRNSGKPLAPAVEGVRTSTLADARRTLLALADAYENAPPFRKQSCRVPVIQAKQRLRSRLSRQGDSETREILLWVSTWLENPTLFGKWLSIREKIGPGSPI